MAPSQGAGMGRNSNPREEDAIKKQLLRMVFGENYVNIYAKTALQSTPSCIRAVPASVQEASQLDQQPEKQMCPLPVFDYDDS